ncbi:hypothetical protein FACS189494_09290 [Spirochaetia bacterium]|nr:hypothetical protein FACS189494_09290 [Spirochaetia bacterium]
MKKIAIVLTIFSIFSMTVMAQNTALPRLAVVEFSTNITTERTKADAITVRNLVESQMIATGKYQMITRDEIDKLMKNQQIAVSSISSSENVEKLKLEEINYIVTGSLDAMQSDYAVTIKVLDVYNGKFSHSADDFMGSGSRDLYNGIGGLMAKFNSGMNASGDKVVQSGNNASRSGGSGQVYKIGDFGPAGGIVFYDKGVFSAGWRYLEAAPAETEFTAQWGAYGKDVSGTSGAIGSGKRNTQVIVDRLRQLNETGRAAQLCATLDFDGFKDWFLPSKDELNLMYTNLKAEGLGGFQNEWYWSSSEGKTSGAWGQHFGGGRQGSDDFNYGKGTTLCVRAVRAF